MFRDLKPAARVVVFAFVALAIVGVFVSVQNMPVISGCKFYGECPDILSATPDADPLEAT